MIGPSRSHRAHAGGLAYAFLYIPYALALATASQPALSYALAWLGSFFILWAVISGRIKPLPADRPVSAQILRPALMTHLVFGLTLALLYPLGRFRPYRIPA